MPVTPQYTVKLQNLDNLHCSSSLVPRPKQPQHGSLPVSRAGKEGLRIWQGVTRIYAWNAGVLNYRLIITFYRKHFFTVLEVRLVSVHATNPNKRSDRRRYRREKLGLAMLNQSKRWQSVILLLGMTLLAASAFWITVKNPTILAVRDLFCKWSKDVVP